MLTLRKNQRIQKLCAAFISAIMLISIFYAPIAQGIAKKNGFTFLEPGDWNLVTTSSGKKAFDMTPKDFSTAYDAIASRYYVVEKEDEYYLLMGLENYISAGKFAKIDINGASIIITGTSKSASKGKIRRLDIEIPMYEYEDYPSYIMGILFIIFSKYDDDILEKMLDKIDSIITSGKSTASFSFETLKFTVKVPEPEDEYGFLKITVSPKS